jgi:hypothetical protein
MLCSQTQDISEEHIASIFMVELPALLVSCIACLSVLKMRLYVPRKCWTASELHGFTTEKMAFFGHYSEKLISSK